MNKTHSDLLEVICQNIPDAICMIDRDWNIMSWNSGAEIMFGYAADEVIGKSLAIIIPEEIFQKEIDHCTGELNRTGRMSAYETVRRTKNGRIIPIELTAVAIRDEGSLTGYASIMRDISERINSQNEITESEESLRTIFNASNDAILVHDIASGKILDVNDKFYELYGYSAEEIPRLDVQAISAGTAGYTNAEALHVLKLAAEGKPQTFQWLARSRNGRIFWIEVNLRRVFLRGRERILATVRDISDRKRVEEDLKLTRFCVDRASLSVILTGPDARIRYVNEETCRTLGYSREELLAMTMHDIDPHFPATRWPSHWAELRKEGTLRFETEHRRKNGSLIPIDISVNYVSFEGREYNWAFMHDMTASKQAEQELRESEERYRSIVETSTDWIWEMNVQGRMTFNNPAVENILGYRPEELEGKNSLDLLYEEDRGTAEGIVSRAIADKEGWKKCLMRWKHRDGSLRFIESNAVPTFGQNGELTGFRGSDHDLTELKRADAELKQAYAELEQKVRERTRELAAANDELMMEVNERKQAVELIRRAQTFSNSLNDLHTVIHSTLNFDEIILRVVKEAAQAIGADGSAVGLIEGAIFHTRYVYNMAGHLAGWKIPLDQLTGVTMAAETGQTLAFNQAAHDQRLNVKIVRDWGIQSMLVSPLIIKKRIAGAISFYSFSNPVVFQQDQIDFARKLSASVSLALENAQLYQALQVNEQRLTALLNSIPDMAWLKDRQGRFILVNEPFARSTGTPVGDLIGKTDYDAWPPGLAERYRADDEEVMRRREVKRVEEPLAVKDGPERWIETIKTCIVNEQGEVVGTAGLSRDITERRRMEEEIRHMAQHDALTGLPNRRMFVDILNLEMAQSRRHQTKLAVLFLDLDRFKEVNDTLGHEAGDRLLKIVAARLRGAIRESDTVARIGGDEFNLVLSDIARVEDVSEIVRKVVDSVARPVVISGHDLHVTTSVGISIYPDDAPAVDTLLRYSDIAMYHAKESGRNTFRFYNPSINVRSLQRMKLAGYLSQAVKRGELTVVYQPQIDIRSRSICHAEALVRWNHPTRGLLQPAEFIPLAEETGFIVDIDTWVLRTVCKQVRTWKDEGFDSFCLSVNMSARQFQSPDLVSLVSSAVEESGLPHACLGLELTESAVMSNVERTADQLHELQRLGISISIDDFGTGYSSLSYLKKLPIDRLKIDKSFIRDIAQDPDDRAIISAVTSMARQMGIRTVAEGVETEEQLAFLRQSECDEAQGFLFSRPVAAGKFRELIEAGR
jgi:diguanylate cyclase (GGDEF)-like protein/PAS domain S-box-containing protein